MGSVVGVNEDFYQPGTHPGDLIDVWDEEAGEMVKHMIILDEFGNGTRTRPLYDDEKEAVAE
ncbi:MAG: hypothetical protein ACTIIN_12860 [Brevibacterium aurantiacum]